MGVYFAGVLSSVSDTESVSFGGSKVCPSSELPVLCSVELTSVRLLFWSALSASLNRTRSSSVECTVGFERLLEVLGEDALVVGESVKCSSSESLISDLISLVGRLEYDAGSS